MKLEGKVSAPSVSAAPKATGADNAVDFTATSGDKNSQNLEWSTDQSTWQSVANKTGNGLTNGKRIHYFMCVPATLQVSALKG